MKEAEEQQQQRAEVYSAWYRLCGELVKVVNERVRSAFFWRCRTSRRVHRDQPEKIHHPMFLLSIARGDSGGEDDGGEYISTASDDARF